MSRRRQFHALRAPLPVVGLFVLVAGVARIPHAQADVAACRYSIHSTTVLDVETDLTWQRTSPETMYSWESAKTYCESLSLGGGGWRLPTIHELQTIVDERAASPAIDTNAFTSTPSTLVWSSTPVVGAPSNAWCVDFADGHVRTTNNVFLGELAVRCVR